MIKIKHFKEPRDLKAPAWSEVEKFLNEYMIGRDRIVSVVCYPTGADHHMVIFYEDPAPQPKA